MISLNNEIINITNFDAVITLGLKTVLTCNTEKKIINI